MEFQKVINNLKQHILAPIYVLSGDEYYLKQQFYQTLFSEDKDYDIQTFNLEESTLDEVMAEANAFSFFDDQRYVVVENALFLQAQAKIKLSSSDEQNLLDYLSSPNPSTILIFEIGSAAIDKRKKLSKLMQKQAEFVDIQPLEDKQVERYIKDYIANTNLNISREAVNELLERVNYQLTSVMGEIAKVETFALSHPQIGIDVIRQLVPRTLESNVFELTNAVMNKQINLAIQIYEDLLLMKHEPIALHALLVSHFRLMLQAKILRSKGLMEGQIAESLKVHPYRVKLSIQSANQIDMHDLIRLYRELAESDYNMKTGIGIKENYFYLLLLKFAQ